MANLQMILSCQKSADTLNEQYQRSTSAKYPTVQSLSDLFSQLVSGNLFRDADNRPQVVVSVLENTPQASATLTFTSAVATNTFVINGVTFTCVNSGAGTNEFNVGLNNTATALSAANAINASATALVAGYVTASAALNVVTVTSSFYGKAGNMTTLTGSANIAANHSRLVGGDVDSDAKTYQF